MSKQPEALRLAEILASFHEEDEVRPMAAELRRLHAVNAELLEALKAALSLIEIVIPFDDEVSRMVRKAIDKAEGQP